MRTIKPTALTLLLLSACGGAEAPAPTVPVPPIEPSPILPSPEAPKTFEDRLRAGIQLSLAPAQSGFSLAVRDGAAPATETRPLPITEGGALLSIDANGQLELHGLEVTLEEIVIAPEVFPPSGLHVVDVRAGLELTAMESSMSDDLTLGTFTGEARLWVTWALLDRQGHRVPLRPLDARADVGGRLHATNSGPVELELFGDAQGTVLLVADRFGLSDVSFSLDLVE